LKDHKAVDPEMVSAVLNTARVTGTARYSIASALSQKGSSEK